MTCWALMRYALGQGHRVTAVAFRYVGDRFGTEDREQAVRDEGAELVVHEVPAELPAPAPVEGLAVEHFPTAALRREVGRTLAEIAPDAAFAYHWDTLAATHGCRACPRLGVVDDLWHLPNLRRWQAGRQASLAYLRWSWATLRSQTPLRRSMAALLNDCEASGSFQSETAAWLRVRGAPGCAYYTAPLDDPLPGGAPPPRPEGAKPRILLGPSNLAATSTAAGLRLFATAILPGLERELGADGFEVHVVGEGDPPAELAALLPRPGVLLRGRVEPADEEYLACDVQLVPTPFVLGKRVRIIHGFAFARCVVAHTAEAANLPELRDGENCLLGGDGEELAAAVVQVVRDARLRDRLGSAARLTYEQEFHPRVAAARLLGVLEQLAGAPAG
jgi:hypothetical protein